MRVRHGARSFISGPHVNLDKYGASGTILQTRKLRPAEVSCPRLLGQSQDSNLTCLASMPMHSLPPNLSASRKDFQWERGVPKHGIQEFRTQSHAYPLNYFWPQVRTLHPVLTLDNQVVFLPGAASRQCLEFGGSRVRGPCSPRLTGMRGTLGP